MRIKKEFSLQHVVEGAYYPGVFIIKIDKVLREGIQYDDFSKEDWQTFVHEYVHFLQDISTSHGYLYYFHKSQLFDLCFYELQTNTTGTVVLPILTEHTKMRNAPAKELLLDFYGGDTSHFRLHHINRIAIEVDEVVTEMISEESELDSEMYSVNIYYDDKDIPYAFGNECIIESMAYLIERYLFGAEERKNELPYNSCEIICQYIYPELLSKPDRISMLCEVSLMHDNCGLFYYGLVDLCKKENLAYLSDAEFVDFCEKNIEAYQDTFELSYDRAKEGIDVLFPSRFPYSFAVNQQLKIFLECGHNFRNAKKLFISDAFSVDDKMAYFMWLINLFDIPILIDGKNDYYGKPGVQNMPVADAVLSILMDRSTECQLRDLCKSSKMPNYDEEICINSPWLQCEREKLCPIAVYFKGYGVDKLEFEKKVKP